MVKTLKSCISFLTKEEFDQITKKLEGGHWTMDTLATRWDYHNRVIELIKAIEVNDSKSVLEMGTMGVTCVKGSDTIDYTEKWNFPGKNPTYVHDARNIPWPINDKQYEVFIALRVFQHLTPFQEACIKEAKRISKKVIIVVPGFYKNTVIPNSIGITYKDFNKFLNGVHPNMFLPTSFGDLYYWDFEKPSFLNIEQVMNNVKLFEYKLINTQVNIKNRITNLIRRVIRKFN